MTTQTTDVRKIVTLRTVDQITPIDGADNIQSATIGGWNVVVKKGEVTAGDVVVFFEIDAALPLDDPRFEFLAPRGTKNFEGRRVHVLRTARLRGVYSQGLVLPADQFEDEILDTGMDLNSSAAVATQFAEKLGVEKYEPPVKFTAPHILGPFDGSLCPKSDSERIQNLDWDETWAEINWVATEKIDGMSTTYSVTNEGDLRVFSRNNEVSQESQWGQFADEVWRNIPMGMTVQGELFGPGIQGNPLGQKKTQFAVYGVYRNRVAVPRDEWPQWAADHAVPTLPDVKVVADRDAMIAAVDGMKSTISPARLAEGVVFHRADGQPMEQLDGRSNFKAINNKYLLKHGG